MTNNTTKPSIYPPYCFDAAPTYNVSSFFRIVDIAALELYRNIPGVHFYRNLPVRWVRIVGLIVAIDDYPERRVYTIDDSSGLNIECVFPLEPRPENTSKALAPGPLIPPEHSEYDVGHVVDLRGPIVPYRRQKAIKIRRMSRVPTTQHELLLWERRLKFRVEALDVPWVLSDEEIRKHRRVAERADAGAATRKSTAQRRGVQAPGVKDEDSFKVRKRATKPPDARAHKLGHRPRDPPNGTETTTLEKAIASRSEARSHGHAGQQDPYSIKAAKTKPALSVRPQPSPPRRLGIQDDPFKITKRGSKRVMKSAQHSTQPSVESVPAAVSTFPENSRPGSVPTTKLTSDSQLSLGGHESLRNPGASNTNRRGESAPTPKPRTEKMMSVGTADDPYVIKARYSRRTLAKPTVSERSTAGPVLSTRSAMEPCLEKSPNVEPRPPNWSGLTSSGKDPKMHGGFRAGAGADDPFRIRKRTRR